jgi:hypothetical protein
MIFEIKCTKEKYNSLSQDARDAVADVYDCYCWNYWLFWDQTVSNQPATIQCNEQKFYNIKNTNVKNK